MATYTYTQMYGPGITGENFSGSTLFTFTNPSGSSYFTIETQTTTSFYNASTPKNCAGTWDAASTMGLITSSYIASVIVPQGTSSVTFRPNISVTGSTYKFRGTGVVNMSTFTPLSLFASSEKGVWFDPSDITTLFQDAAGTVPVTTAGQPVGKILDKSGNNAHATQSVSASRPTYQVDSYGWPYLNFDGVSDFFQFLICLYSPMHKKMEILEIYFES
jgi:hypothetical protein